MPMTEKTENDVEYNCIKWLKDLRWIADRIHVGVFYTRDGRVVAIGRPGQPDWRFKRRRQYMEIEFKAPGKKPNKQQEEYLATMRALGVLCTWVDSLTALQAWYTDANL